MFQHVKILVLLFLGWFISSLNLLAQDADKVVAYGKLKIEWGANEQTKITLYQDGKEIDTYFTTDNGKFEFVLQLNHLYLFHFEKAGYVAKKVEFNTQVPAKVTSDPDFEPFQDFDFNVTLFKTYPEVDTMFFVNPVGKIRYEASINDFDYDKEYTLEIIKRMEEIEDQIKQKHEEDEKNKDKDIKAGTKEDVVKKEEPMEKTNPEKEENERNNLNLTQQTEIQESTVTKESQSKVIPATDKNQSTVKNENITDEVMIEKSTPSVSNSAQLEPNEQPLTLDSPGKTVTRISITQGNTSLVYIKVEYKWGGRFFFIQDEVNQYRNISESYYNLMVGKKQK